MSPKAYTPPRGRSTDVLIGADATGLVRNPGEHWRRRHGRGVSRSRQQAGTGRRDQILPSHLTADPERRARFTREARLLATLNHPHIGAIYGLEEADGLTALVLELIQGPTLADRLARGPLPLADALTLARQIAEALEAAHDQGIVHRDLKPANIVLQGSGDLGPGALRAKVLDFGLAKTMTPEHGDVARGPTVTSDGTREGRILGTPAYMSPEQAKGRAADKRSDIWALGCVLFEMLSGKQTFAGASTAEVLVSVLDREPDWTRLPPDTPENIRCLLRRCLTKDPRGRLHHVADVRLELEETLTGRVGGPVPVGRPRRVSGLVRVGLAAALLTGVAALATLAWHTTSATSEPRVVRFDIGLPPGSRMVPSWSATNLAFSQDGAILLYSVNAPLPLIVYERRLDETDARPLAIAKGLTNPLYPPDDRWLAMTDYAKDSLVKLPLTGGAPVRLAPAEMAFHGEWGRDGFIYWSNALISGIVRTPADGGDTEAVTTVNMDAQERNHRFARLLPGSKAVMFTVASADIETYDDGRIDVVELATKNRKTLIKGGTYARYSPSGHVVYTRGGSLYAVPFDAGALEVRVRR